MSRFMLAWELGGNYGHLGKLVPLTHAIKDKGHDVALAVRDLAALGKCLDRTAATLLQAPIDSHPRRKCQPVSFADILDDVGFGSPERLDGLVRGWHGLFDLYRPEVVVAEYAPSAVFAARLAGIPCLRMDTGFAIPPDVSPYPCFRPWLKLRREQLLEKETGMLQAINQVREDYGYSAHEHLFQAVQADLTLLTTVPELDHYPARKGGRHIGPLLNLDTGQDIPWPGGNGPRIFAYLHPFPGLGLVLDGLRNCGGQTIAVVPGISQEICDRYRGSKFSISDQPATLRHILPKAELVVSHTGHGLTSAALLAGVPTLAIPTQIEQMMLMRTIERLGTGTGVTPNALRTHFQEILQKTLADQEITHRTQELAAKYSRYDERRTLARLITTIERLPETIINRQPDKQEKTYR
ncbi:glycosyltransferase, putative [Geotalea daltonii FRC-32]|uniref:Glycosyltransferase, putative n=1 Tax=Geotalea daltonii (strain DSM 22248 / JCM 15807 / FRC-32) TaxID=316067 RepID=B9M4Y7_GEODF|nr:UDP-glucuronosyltransferase [Geotalea daltonii]ACM21671.1 glycosyltransferase, putative [Geotalea daltonii FRC-32]